MKVFQLVLATYMVLFVTSAFAQSEPKGSGVTIFVGPLLPKNIPVTDEILHAWGMRFSSERAAGRFIEAGFTLSNTEKTSYRDYSLSLRGDIPVNDLTAFFLAGLNLTSFKNTYYGGVHLGGGLLTSLSESAFFRIEMRANFHPGTALLFAFGLEYHF